MELQATAEWPPDGPAGPDGPGTSRPGASAAAPARADVSEADLAAAVRAAKDGDEEAFRLLFRAVQPGLLRYLRVLVGGGPEDAEDIASEAWLQIARDLASFSGDADGFRGWAATIARNRAMDHLRRVRRRPAADLPYEYLAELAAAEDTAGSALTAVSTSDSIALIARLPRDQAEAVLLRVVVGLDAESAARVLGKRSGSVRMAAHRGLRKLAKLLEQHGGPDGGIPGRAATGQAPGGQALSSQARTGQNAKGKRSSKNVSQGVTEPRAATLKDMR